MTRNVVLTVILIALLAIALNFIPVANTAQPDVPEPPGVQCGPTSLIVGALKNKYFEAPLVQLVQLVHKDGQSLIHVFANQHTKTWTLIMTGLAGMTCILSNGTGYSGTLGRPV